MTRIVIVEDENVTGLGIEALLERSGFEVLGTEQTPEAAVRLARRASPDVIVCDVMFGNEPLGLRLPVMLRSAGMDLPVLHLSGWNMPYYVRRAREAGAMGYVLKTAGLDTLRAAITKAAARQPAFPPQYVVEPVPTARQLEVIRHVAAGRRNPEIARRMGLTTRTVEGHLRTLYLRFGLPDRTRLITLAFERGWITLGDIRTDE